MRESVAALLERGADIELGNSEGWTALFEAADKGHVETVSLLLKQGALPTVVDSSGSSPADYARSRGYQQIVDLLESAKAPGQ
jgi:ankyrin repeat protein